MASDRIEGPKFRVSGHLKENSIKQQSVANLIGKSLGTTNRKIRGKSGFTVDEIQILHDNLEIPIEIFFN